MHSSFGAESGEINNGKNEAQSSWELQLPHYVVQQSDGYPVPENCILVLTQTYINSCI